MKKYSLALSALVGILALTGCDLSDSTSIVLAEPIFSTKVPADDRSKSLLVQKVMVRDEIYFGTGEESELIARCGMMDGEITSQVKESETPIQNDQSNFGTGYGYQFIDEDALDIYMNEKWMRFKLQPAAANRLGITLSATDITSTGMTLICTQSGGNPVGEITSGEFYIIEKELNNEWEALPLVSEINWIGIARIIPQHDHMEWTINWEALYGSLPTGSYRISKEIQDGAKSTDESKTYYAYFEL